jgi:hypothetical protein
MWPRSIGCPRFVHFDKVKAQVYVRNRRQLLVQSEEKQPGGLAGAAPLGRRSTLSTTRALRSSDGLWSRARVSREARDNRSLRRRIWLAAVECLCLGVAWTPARGSAGTRRECPTARRAQPRYANAGPPAATASRRTRRCHSARRPSDSRGTVGGQIVLFADNSRRRRRLGSARAG